MTSLAQIGPELGFGGRAHVFEATTIEGELIALKVYHLKRFCKNELLAYEYLQQLGHNPIYLPQYHGRIPLNPENLRTIHSSMHDAQCYTRTAMYRTRARIERVEGLCLDKLINNMSDGELKCFEEKILAALLDLHNNAGICHKDIKAENILLPSSHSSRTRSFVLIDFSEAIIRKYTHEAIWKKACKDDIQALREVVFKDAGSAKAVMLGCQLIQDATSISQPSSVSDSEMSNQLTDNLQEKLSHLLSSAQSGRTVTFLIDKRPISQLALALVRALRYIGRLSDALRIVESCIGAGFDGYDSIFIPSFDFQKAKILQSFGSSSLKYFSSALVGFEAQLGPDHITTHSCRYELALQHAHSGDITTAKTMLTHLSKIIGAKTTRTKKESRLLGESGRRLRNFQLLHSPCHINPLPKSNPNSRVEPILAEPNPLKRSPGTSINAEPPPAKRSRRSRDMG